VAGLSQERFTCAVNRTGRETSISYRI